MKKAATVSLSLIIVGYMLAIFLPVNPDEARPGTRLSGDVAKGEINLSSIKGVKLVTVQTSTWYLIPHSVTVTSSVVDDNYTGFTSFSSSQLMTCFNASGLISWPISYSR